MTGSVPIHVTVKSIRVTTVAVEKQIYSKCVSVILVIQYAKHMRRITYIFICGLSCCTILFQATSYASKCSGKKGTLNVQCVLIFF
jgi:hypothetical protein